MNPILWGSADQGIDKSIARMLHPRESILNWILICIRSQFDSTEWISVIQRVGVRRQAWTILGEYIKRVVVKSEYLPAHD